ncbi:hypothetical protein [Halorientalis halophila]|uniref:hypothetical protein n=1 Tax=Halorientalis halophila TaxID=3108499 RepID=UPI00300ACFF1
MKATDVVYEKDTAVSETRARVLAINEALNERLESHLDDRKQTVYRAGIVGGIGAIIGLLGLVIASSPFWVFVILASIGIAVGGYVYADQQSSDIEIKGVEKGYWNGYCIPRGPESVVVYDGTDSVPRTEFNLERLTSTDPIQNAHERLDEINEFPVIMPESNDLEKEVTDVLTSVEETLDSSEEQTVEVPVVPADSPESETLEYIAEQADSETFEWGKAIDETTATEDVEMLFELQKTAAEDGGDEALEDISERSQQLVDDLSGLQETAVELLNDHVQTAADAFGIVSYNFYCPDCLRDDIDSQVTLSDPETSDWYCDTCRSHHETENLVPRHELKDDLVNPVWDQLWAEKDDERRKIYGNIEDQKSDLKEREFEQRQEEIRSATDRIRDLRAEIRDLQTKAKASRGTVDRIGELMVKYDRLNEQRKEEFRTDVEESFEDIDEKTEEILEETRNEDQERLEEAEQAAKQKAELLREEERQRERAKFIAEQQAENQRMAHEQERADARTQAKMEQEYEQHVEQHNFTTRGKMSSSSVINKARYAWDRLTGASVRGGK